MTVITIGDGVYRVVDGDRTWKVAVAGPPENRWVWVNGRVTRLRGATGGRARSGVARDELSAPMPATVVKVMVEPGATVAPGDTLIVLEAMKMELPIRAPMGGLVAAIHCRPGELVQPGVHLIDLTRVEPRT